MALICSKVVWVPVAQTARPGPPLRWCPPTLILLRLIDEQTAAVPCAALLRVDKLVPYSAN